MHPWPGAASDFCVIRCIKMQILWYLICSGQLRHQKLIWNVTHSSRDVVTVWRVTRGQWCMCVVRGQVRDWREEDEVVTKHWAYPVLSLVSPGNIGLSLADTGTCHDVIMKRKLWSGCLVITGYLHHRVIILYTPLSTLHPPLLFIFATCFSPGSWQMREELKALQAISILCVNFSGNKKTISPVISVSFVRRERWHLGNFSLHPSFVTRAP